MHLEVISQGQPNVVTSSAASEGPEVNCRPMASPFDVRNFHLRLTDSRLAVRFQNASWWVCVPR
jgi:hypothetical protein